MTAFVWGVMIATAYLLGSIPAGLILSRLKGVDIRSVGSGNIGATNVFRSVSKGLGIATFAFDFLKGFVPAGLFPALAQAFSLLPQEGPLTPLALGLLCGCAAIAGHNWPVYVDFKGGKGVATSAGVLLGVAPSAVGIAILAWIILFLTTRYVSVASIGAAIAIAAIGWFVYEDDGYLLPIALTILGILVLIRHRTNIRRLFSGEEHRFEFKRKRPHESHETTRNKKR